MMEGWTERLRNAYGSTVNDRILADVTTSTTVCRAWLLLCICLEELRQYSFKHSCRDNYICCTTIFIQIDGEFVYIDPFHLLALDSLRRFRGGFANAVKVPKTERIETRIRRSKICAPIPKGTRRSFTPQACPASTGPSPKL